MHDGREGASDHIPVKVDFVMEGSRRSRVNRAAYIKMDVDTFTDPARHCKFKDAWLEGWSLSPDPIVEWELAWGRVRQLYAVFRSEDQSIRSKLQGKKIELEDLRIQVAEDPTSVDTVAYRDLEMWVRKADLLEHQILRRRSRLTWVRQGDACTKFFFSALKSKQSKERLAVIVTDDGRTITEEKEILEEVHDYYKAIYQQPEITDEERRARDSSLQLIQSRVPEQEKRRIAEKPTMKELEQTIESMAREKAPGEDGLTIEVLLASWGWTGQACLQLLLEFWRYKSLGWNNLSAVVKLLPKSDQKEFLRNWRPISLLPLIYKIAARILAARIKPLIPTLVDEEQVGFVDGRSTTDNILCLKLSQELARERNQPSIFCKLDFSKAFDRLQHEFLWETMRQMNFGAEYIQLVQGLVAQGSTKIHLNGASTASFPLKRGVRQGCPISPLLFALSTQPLMLMIREEERRGNLTGLRIPNGRPLLHRLFADDSGITLKATERNFSNLRSTIARFERISGASLNVNKSVILPMAMSRLPRWLHDTGCKILVGGDEVKYLGIKAGAEVTEEAHARDLAERLKKQALKLGQMARILEGERNDWTQMLRYFLSSAMSRQTSRREYRTWTVEEGLLLLPSIPTGGSTTTKHLIKGWEKARGSLKLDTKQLSLPGTLSMIQLSLLLNKYGGGCKYNERIVMQVLKRLGIITLGDIQAQRGRWKLLLAEIITYRLPVTLEQAAEINRFQIWLGKVTLGSHSLQGSPSWRWSGSEDAWKGWPQPTKFWSKLLLKPKEPDDMSGRWPANTGFLDWKDRWKLLWEKGDTTRCKLWVRRTIRKGIFTGSRAQKMQVSQDLCKRCNTAQETISHMFWSCPVVRQIWDELRRRTWEADLPFKIHQSLLGSIDEALQTKKSSGTLLSIIAAVFQTVWKDRNAFIFQNKRGRTPLLLILHAAREELEGSCQITSSEARWNRGLRALQEINQLIASYTRPPLPTQMWNLSLHSQDNLDSRRMKLETHRLAQRSSGQDPRPTEATIDARIHENVEDTLSAGATLRVGNTNLDERSHVAATNVPLHPADISLVTKETGSSLHEDVPRDGGVNVTETPQVMPLGDIHRGLTRRTSTAGHVDQEDMSRRPRGRAVVWCRRLS
ncbi:hypothetical protein R1sor_017389 [Riccia sorocarpa]|uniref:Reverse transcriptase domain-containing protein n=1 Tax=Riccia sorocarpa TaxID=122646 RepID=A0ABD3I9H2_9MARC